MTLLRVAPIVLALAACVAASPAAAPGALEAALQAGLTACSARHGYDPNAAASLGPHELAAHEPAWSECVYGVVRRDLMAASRIPEAYRRVIESHKTLSAQIAAGETTRARRRVHIERMIAAIREQERALYLKEHESTMDALQDNRHLRRRESRRLDAIHRDIQNAAQLLQARM